MLTALGTHSGRVTDALLVVALATAAAGCRAKARGPEVTELAVAASKGSSTPRLVAQSDGELLLSWTEPSGAGHALRWARLGPGGASAPATAASGAGWLINWADFPAVVARSPQELWAHWLVRRAPVGGAPQAGYEIRLSSSRDGGASWTPPWSPHGDGTDTEHGFVTMVPSAKGGPLLVWLDGRAFAGLPHDEAERRAAMQLRAAPLRGDPAPAGADESVVVDERTCSCCQTSAAAIGDDVLVAYRDRDADELRDIAVVRFAQGRWEPPRIVAPDGWQIDGCPVNGPALAARQRDVALAWYTEAAGQPTVRLAWSRDGGGAFSAPVRVDDGRPQGRVAVALWSTHLVVSWQEIVGPAVALRVRAVGFDGRLGEPLTVATVAAGRSSGFPQLAALGDGLVLAYTEVDAGGKAQVRVLRVAGVERGL